MDRQEAENERRTKRQYQARETAIKILRDAAEEEKERQTREEDKRKAYNAKLEEEFIRDKKARDLAAAKQDEASMKAAVTEKFISQKLEETEQMTQRKLAIKEAQLKKRMDMAEDHSRHQVEVYTSTQEQKKKFEEDTLLKYVQKSIKMDKTRQNVASGAYRTQQFNRDKISHRERLEEINRMKEEQARDMKRKIQNGIKQREKQVAQNMSYLREENERRKEVKHLHKLDQVESLTRKLAFDKIMKQNRVEMILEKASRTAKSPSDIR